MMSIKLYNIIGIDRDNAPYFASNEKREAFFANNYVYSNISSFYYPPLYENTIRMNISEFDINLHTVNYMRLELDGSIYYYFITSVSYINPELYEISIEMDTITTYLNDINVLTATIERKHISRWLYKSGVGWTINRDYIRENFSKGEMIKNVKHILEQYQKVCNTSNMFDSLGNYIGPWIIGVVDKVNVGITGGNFAEAHFLRKDMTKGNDGSCIFGAPLYRLGEAIDLYEGTTLSSNIKFDIFDFIGSPYVREIHIIRHLPKVNTFSDYIKFDLQSGKWLYNYTHSQVNITVSWGSGHESVIYAHRLRLGYFVSSYIESATPFGTYGSASIYCETSATVHDIKYDIDATTGEKVLTFIRSSSLATYFKSSFEPAMLDENYSDFVFGTSNFLTRYPLHKLIQPITNLKMHNLIDYGSGCYTYKLMLDDEINSTEYNTSTTDTGIVYYTLINDAFQEYIASNRMRWQSAMFQDAVTVLGTMAKVGALSYSASASAKSYEKKLLSNPKMYTKKGRLRVAAASRIASKYASEDKENLAIAGGALGNLNTGVGWTTYITEQNNLTAPSRTVNVGSFFTDAYSGACDLYYQIATVNDYEYCANMYRRYGNLVMEFKDYTNYDGNSNVVKLEKCRYYFNYIKCVDINLYIVNNNIGDDIKNDIIDRYLNGITFWNVYTPDNSTLIISNNNLFTNVKYDNVETLFI